MRGKGNLKIALVLGVGITPAHAGKRRCPRFRPGKIRDHPRTCGEKVVWSAPLYEQMGSPPHMRGKGAAPALALCHVGITPAHAGKRQHLGLFPLKDRDHPRTCGEKPSTRTLRELPLGSPPHMRGKARRTRLFEVLRGITPAHAGKSPAPPR